MSGVVEADAALPLVLMHDGTRVAMREPVLVRQPVGAFLTSEERWSRFQALEPLDQVTSSYGRDARDHILMRLQGVVQGHEHLQGRPTPCCRACTTGTSLTTPPSRCHVSCGPLPGQDSRSTIIAIPWPPPTHIVSRPNVLSWNCRLFRSVLMILAPAMPKGWPTAIAPPLTFSLSMSMDSSR